MTADLFHLPGTQLTPEVLLYNLLKDSKDMRSVCVVIQWKDEEFEVSWSQQKTSELAMCACMLSRTATRQLG